MCVNLSPGDFKKYKNTFYTQKKKKQYILYNYLRPIGQIVFRTLFD